jgi:hypothetical protein
MSRPDYPRSFEPSPVEAVRVRVFLLAVLNQVRFLVGLGLFVISGPPPRVDRAAICAAPTGTGVCYEINICPSHRLNTLVIFVTARQSTALPSLNPAIIVTEIVKYGSI